MATVPFQTASNVGIYGSSGSGKTHLLYEILKASNELFTEKPKHVLFYYSVWQPKYNQIQSISHLSVYFVEGLPSSEQEIIDFSVNIAKKQHFITVFDDLMSAVSESSFLEKFFTVITHHYKISCIYLAQNIFFQGKNSRTISLQLHYFILMRSLRDVFQIQVLGKQVFPGKVKKFMDIYFDSTEKSYSYLLLDVNPHTANNLRLRTNILPNEQTIIYSID